MATKIKALSKRDIEKLKKEFPEWKLNARKTKISRTFTFEKHIDALIFIARSTVNAEILKHYPDISFTYCKVKVTVTTHKISALTKQDIQLVSRIDMVGHTQQQGDNKTE